MRVDAQGTKGGTWLEFVEASPPALDHHPQALFFVRSPLDLSLSQQEANVFISCVIVVTLATSTTMSWVVWSSVLFAPSEADVFLPFLSFLPFLASRHVFFDIAINGSPAGKIVFK
jgi:hypothetical protein